MRDGAHRAGLTLLVQERGAQGLAIDGDRLRKQTLVPEPQVHGALELHRVDAADRPPQRAVLRGHEAACSRTLPAAQGIELRLRQGGGKRGTLTQAFAAGQHRTGHQRQAAAQGIALALAAARVPDLLQRGEQRPQARRLQTRGDPLAKVRVVLPEQLTAREQQLVREWAQLRGSTVA